MTDRVVPGVGVAAPGVTADPRIWQFPMFVIVSAVCAALAVAGYSGGAWSGTAVGWLLVALATGGSLLPAVRRTQWRLVLPVADLVGAIVVNAHVQTVLPTAQLLAALPMVWLGFEFGRRGVAIANVGAIGVVLLPYGFGMDLQDRTLAGIDIALTMAIGVGVTAIAYVVSGLLRETQEQLVRDARRLTVELDTVNAVMDAVDAAVLIVLEGEQPRLNAHAVRIAGLAGADIDNFVDGPHVYEQDGITLVPVERRALARARAGESFHGSLNYMGVPGDQMAMLTSCQQMTSADGDRSGVVIVGVDATALMESVRVREEFLTTVSHELRTPLTSISASLEMLHGEIEDVLAAGRQVGEEVVVERLLAIAERNAATLLARIEHLLSAAPGAVEELHPELYDVGQLVRDSAARHHERGLSHGVVLTVEADDAVRVTIDRAAFERVVDNLVSNAVKYTGSGGCVVVTLRRRHQRLELAVRDTGIGMTRDVQRQVFERFYRAAAVVEAGVPGIGIGLSVTKRLVHLLGGEIDIDSRLGVGTTMTVTLPASAAAEVRLGEVTAPNVGRIEV